MEVKEAIEFIEDEKLIICGRATQCPEAKGFNEVVALLKRGEKSEKMWEELYAEYGMCPIRKNDEEGYMSNILYKILEELQRKYFPKEAKQDYPESGE